MQFYRVMSDPELNAKFLPDYAIKSVNVREGYQILSDCGHALGVSWETQNKEYNRCHPNTWRHWKNPRAFYDFLNHYIACLSEADNRGFTKIYETYRAKLQVFIVEVLPDITVPDLTEEQHMAKYLLHRKSKHLSEEEIETLCLI